MCDGLVDLLHANSPGQKQDDPLSTSSVEELLASRARRSSSSTCRRCPMGSGAEQPASAAVARRAAARGTMVTERKICFMTFSRQAPGLLAPVVAARRHETTVRALLDDRRLALALAAVERVRVAIDL